MATPISVPASQSWDGNDGPWSSFVIRVGNPPQVVSVLASTAVPETWVIDKRGCTSQDPSNCAASRGHTFNPNTTTTWKDQGLYGLGAETNLPYTSNFDDGDYGFDTLGLGYSGSGGPALDHQVVATVATKDFYLGNLGLTPRPVNFSSFDNPSPSFLTSLRNQSLIPSLSYGYNAGAQYRFKKVLGSLTLGGYDSSRFVPNNVVFNFASDISRDLVVALRSIQVTDSSTTNKELLPSGGILTFIDSTVPHIWLPINACKAFEDAFGITYDNQTQLYLVNDTLHGTLVKQNASLSFVLGNDAQGGETVNITFPYAAFDLQVEYPIVNSTTHYFPLRRAANDSQYTLGRTFLQEAFLTVDYERTTFKVSQALWQQNASPNLMPILSVNASTPRLSPATPQPNKLSSGATAGIAVGAVVLCLFIVGAGIFYFWRKKRRGHDIPESDSTDDKVEMDGTSALNPLELHSDVKVPGELNGDGEPLSSDRKLHGAEMEGSPAPRDRAEVQGTPGGVEMEGSRGGAEMEGSSVPEMGHGGQSEVFELPANEHLTPGSLGEASHGGRQKIDSNPRRNWRRSRGNGS